MRHNNFLFHDKLHNIALTLAKNRKTGSYHGTTNMRKLMKQK